MSAGRLSDRLRHRPRAGAWRNPLLFLVILPFWTSLLIRVYAWIAILQPSGLVNRLLLAAGPRSMRRCRCSTTGFSVELGLVYSYLPFMILPLYGSLSRLDESLVEAAADLGAPPWRVFLRVVLPLTLPGIAAGSAAGLYPGDRRVRHPRPPRRPRHADDRQGAVAGILRQCRLAGRVGRRDGAGRRC